MLSKQRGVSAAPKYQLLGKEYIKTVRARLKPDETTIVNPKKRAYAKQGQYFKH